METDLHAVIRANILQDIHKQYIMYQGFKAIKYMHSAKLVHRDLKPSNMLLNAECLMKVADFGLARSLLNDMPEGEHRDHLTDYVATRWYRAPEILLGSNTYGKSVVRAALPTNGPEEGAATSASPPPCAPHAAGGWRDRLARPAPVWARYRWARVAGARPARAPPRIHLARLARPAASAHRFSPPHHHQPLRPRSSTAPAPRAQDLWSLGCIFGEMLAGRPLFPGSNTLDQLQRVGAVIGAPDVDEIAKLDSVYTLEMLDGMEFPLGELKPDGSRAKARFSRAKPPEPGQGGGNPWEQTYPKVSADAIDLMKQMMQYDPDKRITSDGGLVHPYCEQFHDAPTEPNCENFVAIPHNDNKKYQTQLYRDALYTLVDDHYDETKKKR